MTGLAAINANNGWLISFLGVSIVFTGLTLLSLAISQLHKALNLFDRRKEIFKSFTEKPVAAKT